MPVDVCPVNTYKYIDKYIVFAHSVGYNLSILKPSQQLNNILCRKCTCKCKATSHVAAEYGNLLSGYLTPACIISHHRYDWCLATNRIK